MSKEEVIVRFDNVSFKYSDKKIILNESNFSVRKNSKLTIMGQNGAGKSTLFKLLTGKLKPTSGKINIILNAKIGIAEQMIAYNELDLSIKEFFESRFEEKIFGIEGNIKKVLDAVNLKIDIEKKVKELSGGQKSRLLLAGALILDPDILLLDEPTNNLDQEGIEHLTYFLMAYQKTVLVISHDANFLNAFTDGVLNLDVYTKKIEQFVGDYYSVLNQIEVKREKDRMLNARIEKSVRDRFEKINKLGAKSVAMRRLARRVREDIEEDREKIVDIRKDDKTIPEFNIPYTHIPGSVIEIHEVSFLKDMTLTKKQVHIDLRRGKRLLIKGPNGIGKSSLLRSILNGKGCKIAENAKIGYYSQDFSELDFSQTAYDSLVSMVSEHNPQRIYETTGRFLLTSEILKNEIGSLSEGQKGLLCYARFMLQAPSILIMDEPTNHINFRHIPVISKALNSFEGPIILVSHLADFVESMDVTDELDLGRL